MFSFLNQFHEYEYEYEINTIFVKTMKIFFTRLLILTVLSMKSSRFSHSLYSYIKLYQCMFFLTRVELIKFISFVHLLFSYFQLFFLFRGFPEYNFRCYRIWKRNSRNTFFFKFFLHYRTHRLAICFKLFLSLRKQVTINRLKA